MSRFIKCIFIKVGDHWVYKDDENGIVAPKTDNVDEVGPSINGTNQYTNPMPIK